MTLEARYYAELPDVLSVRIVCANCKSSVSIAPIEPNFIPSDCPHCKKPWFMENTPEHTALGRLLKILIDSRSNDTKSIYTVQIELPNSKYPTIRAEVSH
jgi:hypothetical protein